MRPPRRLYGFKLMATTGLIVLLSGSAQAQFLNVTAARNLGGYQASAGDNHGPGGVFADLNNDGYPDLVLVTGPGLKTSLYRNVAGPSGTRTFQRSDLHPTHTFGSTGAIAGDYDNDGDLDIYLINHPKNSPPGAAAPNVLYKNRWIETGNLTFQDVTGSAGVSHVTAGGVRLDHTLTACWLDYDRDGDLDLYLGNHDGWLNNPEEAPKPGQRDILYRNNGNGTFTDVTTSAGAEGYVSSTGQIETAHQKYSSSNAVVSADLDNDGWPDLFVTNKVGGPTDADMTYINQGVNGSGFWQGFTNVTYNLTPPFGRVSGAAMGVDAGDFDNDGDLDLYITDVGNPGAGQNDLLVNLLPTFDYSVNHSASNHVKADFSWGTKWEDFNNDGRLDLYVATAGGRVDFVYLWDSSLNRFVNRASAWNVNINTHSRGVLAADYDRDGATDLFIVALQPALWENRTAAGGTGKRYLNIKLQGDPTLSPGPFRSSRDAIGAKIFVSAAINGGSNKITQRRDVISGSGNAGSTSALDLRFGVGRATSADVTVRWPSGRVSRLAGTPTNRFLTIRERDSAFSCSAGAKTLCLRNGRFKAEVDWHNPANGQRGEGFAVADPGGNSAGHFWFFDSQNLEVSVKVLDGRPINGHFWVYHGAATGLHYSLRVTDTTNGTVKVFEKTGSSLCGGADTGAFTSTSGVRGVNVVSIRKALKDDAGMDFAAQAACTTTSTQACLLGNRFRVQVKRGGVNQRAFKLTGQTGSFWFFSADNPEVVVKVIDGRALNGKFWVLYGSMTDQVYQVVVTDTATGSSKTYNSTVGSCGRADTAAF